MDRLVEMVVGLLCWHMASSAQLSDIGSSYEVFSTQFIGLLVITLDEGHKNLEVDVSVKLSLLWKVPDKAMLLQVNKILQDTGYHCMEVLSIFSSNSIQGLCIRGMIL